MSEIAWLPASSAAVISSDKLAQLARGREFEPFDRSLDVQISRLRKMLEPDPAQPRYIQTVWGGAGSLTPSHPGPIPPTPTTPPRRQP